MALAGHVRFTISPDGTAILRRDALSRDCIFRNSRETPGRRLASVYTLHPLSDTPIETHVMLSLFLRAPVYVITSDRRTWVVQSGYMWTVR